MFVESCRLFDFLVHVGWSHRKFSRICGVRILQYSVKCYYC